MNDGNTNLSETAQKAMRRIRVLQILHERTGFSTQKEQYECLMALNDEDLLAASAAISAMRKPFRQGQGISNGNAINR